MKKAAVFLVLVLVIVGAIYFRNSREEETPKNHPGDKYIGAVSVTLYEESTELPGTIVGRRYLETEESYEQEELAAFTDTMPRFTQLAEEFTTATTTTTITTETLTKDQTATSTEPEEGTVSDLEVKYVGELLGVPTYTIYDDQYEIAVDPQERLHLPTEPGLYYVESEVKWGKKRNYTMMRYYFIIEVLE